MAKIKQARAEHLDRVRREANWQRRRALMLVLVGSGLRPSQAQRAAQEQARAALDPDGTAEIPPVRARAAAGPLAQPGAEQRGRGAPRGLLSVEGLVGGVEGGGRGEGRAGTLCTFV